MLDLHRRMLAIRLCEESLVEPILDGSIRCPVHLCSGQEAVAVGVCAALRQDDYVMGNHRSHGHFLAKGGRMEALVAEVFGKEGGCSRGRGGSMHLIDPSVGMLGSAPIVSGTISLALGAALAGKIRGDQRVAVSFFGDGATGEGVLYESLNFAALMHLPMLFVCENNLYATHMPIGDCRPACALSDIARPFGMESVCVEGNDVLAVLAVAQEAVAACREGRGPVFIEASTYRLRGHVGPDDNIQGTHTDIRPPEELARWRENDPITTFEARLVAEGAASDEELARMRGEVGREVEAAHAFAAQSPHPPAEELAAHLFKHD